MRLQDRTYPDARQAFSKALALLVRLHQAATYHEAEDPSESYATPAVVSLLESDLAIFGPPDASTVFRSAADHYCWSWRDHHHGKRLEQEIADFVKGSIYRSGSAVAHETLADLKERRYRAANDSRNKYQRAERSQKALTELAREHLSGQSEG